MKSEIFSKESSQLGIKNNFINKKLILGQNYRGNKGTFKILPFLFISAL